MKKAALILIILFIVPFASGLLKSPLQDDYCVDTDSFKNNPEYVRGYAQDSTGYYWDECTNDHLIERECSEGAVVYKTIECEKGCFRGACIKYSFIKLPTFRLPIQEKWDSLQIKQPAKPVVEKKESKAPLKDTSLELKVTLLEAKIDALQAALLSLFPEVEIKPVLTSDSLVFPLTVRVTKVEGNLNSGIIEEMFYLELGMKDGELSIEEVDSGSADIELMAESSIYEKLEIEDFQAAESIIANALDSDKAKFNTYSAKGELAHKLELIRLKSYSESG